MQSIFQKGKCIGKGTYDHLISTGIDFMSLLHQPEEPDSALETDYDEDEGRSRSFSRQASGIDDAKGKGSPHLHSKNLSVVAERALSPNVIKRRSEISLSYKEPDEVGSDLSIASNSARVKVFVS